MPLYLPSLFSAIGRGATLVALPLFALDIEGGAALVGLVLAARGVGTMFVDIPAGLLVAKLGDKTVMVASLLCLLVGALLAVPTQGPWLLIVVALVHGVGSGGWILSRLAVITHLIEMRQRGRVISVVAATERTGQLLGPIIAGAGIQYFGYDAVFILIGLCFIFALVPVILFTTTGARHVERHRPISLWQVIYRSRHTFLGPGSVMVILSMLRSARLFLIPVWGATIALTPLEISQIFSLAALLDVMMFLPAGYILDHLGRKVSLIPCIVLLGLSTLILPLTTDYWSFASVAMLAGIANGFGTGIFMTLGSDYAPRYGGNQFLGVWRLVGDSGQAGGPVALGYAVEALGMTYSCVGISTLAAVAVVLLLSVVAEPTKSLNPRQR